MNQTLKQERKILKRIMGVTMDDNYESVPVRVTHASGTTQVIEDGSVVECDHAGAHMDDISLASLQFNPTTGTVEEVDNTQRALACDKCPAWKIPAGSEWYE